MSRVGKKPIPVPAAVKIQVGDELRVEGPKGKLTVPIPQGIRIEQNNGTLNVLRESDQHAAAHGLTRALTANAVTGVATGWTRELWIYDFRTNEHFTLKQNPLRCEHLDDFVAAYEAREETERFKRFTYDELLARDKVSLDITWLRDESLEDTDNLPAPEVIAQEIVEDLEAALAEFSRIASALASASPG